MCGTSLSLDCACPSCPFSPLFGWRPPFFILTHLFRCLARAWPDPMLHFTCPSIYMPNSHEMQQCMGGQAGRGRGSQGQQIRSCTTRSIRDLHIHASSCLVAYVDRSYGLRRKNCTKCVQLLIRIQVFHLFSWGREVKALYTPRTAFTRCFKLWRLTRFFSPRAYSVYYST